jgi:hypothetical protein
MRFLTPPECETILRSTGLPIFGGSAASHRLAAGPPRDADRLGNFVEALLRWLPDNRGRLLWITGWSRGHGNPFEAFKAVRAGLCEHGDLADTPGHYVGPFSWTWDELEIVPDQARAASLLTGLLSMVMGSGWDAWLAAEDCGDTIEFWEGNVLFHAASAAKLEDAAALLRNFNARDHMR